MTSAWDLNAGSSHSGDRLFVAGRNSERSMNGKPVGRGWSFKSQEEHAVRRRISRRFVPKPWYNIWSNHVVENKFFIGLTTFLTLWALTADDCRLIFTDKPSDPFFDAMVVLCLLVFAVELVVSCIGKDDYFLGFFFWLDLFSTASLVMDLTFVAEAVSSLGSSEEEGGAKEMRSGRTARLGAKAGRVVRVLRLVRILKLYKAYYEARQERLRRQREKEMQLKEGMNPGDDDDDWDDEDLQGEDEKEPQVERESRVGKKLSEMTTRRTICLILAMLLVLPQLVTEVGDQVPFSAEFGADHVQKTFQAVQRGNSTRMAYERAMLQYVYYHNWFAYVRKDEYCTKGDCAADYLGHIFWVGVMGKESETVIDHAQQANLSEAFVSAWEGSYAETTNGIYNYGTMPDQAKQILAEPWGESCSTTTWTRQGFSLLAQEIDGVVGHTVTCPQDLRSQEQRRFFPRMMSSTDFDQWHLTFYFDLRPFVKWNAIYGLLMTLCVLILLILGSLMFSHDANRLVLNPVEKMIKRVQIIRENPIMAMKMADEEFKAEEIAKAKQRRQNKEVLRKMCKDLVTCKLWTSEAQEPMETVILEKSIIKLGSLLALGFGEAGANIISHNMKGDDSAGVDAMVPGTSVECIIGVARLQDFSTATEVLQAKIMTFVNQVAEIIHGVANEYHGAPNQNSGESFLLIWRIGVSHKHHELTGHNRELASRYADLSVVAFCKIFGSLHRSPTLAQYRYHPGLQYRLGKGYRVSMSFGLHAGWAIEGAVGSDYKIDASYLSPNVSIAQNVELSTKIYGVALMVADSVVRLCSRDLVAKYRLIDHVKIRGARNPMELYCVDLDYRSVTVERSQTTQLTWNTRNRFKARQFIEQVKAANLRPELGIAQDFNDDPTISTMRRRYTTEFFQLFSMGYQNYSEGEWQVARRMLACTRALLGVEDGPSAALLNFMEEPYQFEAPKGWQGHRVLELGSG